MKIIYTYRKSIKKCQGRLRAAWQLFVRPRVWLGEAACLLCEWVCDASKVMSERGWRWWLAGRRWGILNNLKSPLMNIKSSLADSSSATSLQTSVMCLFALRKGSVQISIKSSVVSLMALSMERRPIPLYTSAQLCVNHPSLILPSARFLSPGCHLYQARPALPLSTSFTFSLSPSLSLKQPVTERTNYSTPHL